MILLRVGLLDAMIFSCTLPPYLLPGSLESPDFLYSLLARCILACIYLVLFFIRVLGLRTSSPLLRSEWLRLNDFIIERPSFAFFACAISFLFSCSPGLCKVRCVRDCQFLYALTCFLSFAYTLAPDSLRFSRITLPSRSTFWRTYRFLTLSHLRTVLPLTLRASSSGIRSMVTFSRKLFSFSVHIDDLFAFWLSAPSSASPSRSEEMKLCRSLGSESLCLFLSAMSSI